MELLHDKSDTRVIEIIADESLIKERVGKPRVESEADFKVYKIIQAEWEPVPEKHLILQSTDNNIDDMLQRAIAYLHLRKDDKTRN